MEVVSRRASERAETVNTPCHNGLIAIKIIIFLLFFKGNLSFFRFLPTFGNLLVEVLCHFEKALISHLSGKMPFVLTTRNRSLPSIYVLPSSCS